MSRVVAAAGLFLAMVWNGTATAGGWPTYMHDSRRGGITREALSLPLEAAWVFEARRMPEPAWPAPAGQDFYHRHYDLRPTVAYDRAFQVVGADGAVYFGSSAEDYVSALDAHTGKVRWTFFTEGPVRFAPTVSEDRLYFGSDDGCVYCLRAKSGSLVWKQRVAPKRRMVPGNGRMISLWPVRTGVVVEEGTVYCTAGLFPTQGAYLAALDAQDGQVRYRHAVEVSAQGYLLASPDRLYVPTGRTNPAIFERSTGAFGGTLPSAGGAYALLVEDILVTGPGRGAKQIGANDLRTKDSIATFGGLRMLVKGGVAYMQSERELSAFDRERYLELARELNALLERQRKLQDQLKKTEAETTRAGELRKQIADLSTQMNGIKTRQKACYLWTAECDCPHAMVMAGETLFVGGNDRVAAVRCATGEVLWNAAVKGEACGLAVLDGGLYVSTSLGSIYCFRNGPDGASRAVVRAPRVNSRGPDEQTDLYAGAVEYIAAQAGPGQGYCVVLDCEEGRLACELARRTNFRIVAVEREGEKVALARRRLAEAGLYGRVAVHHVPAGELPFTSCFANLVVSDGMLTGQASAYSGADIARFVRPYGGTVLLGGPSFAGVKRELAAWGRGLPGGLEVRSAADLMWGIWRRGRLEGAGEWTHMYAEPGNGACSGDEVVCGPMAVQWFGEPGPAEMIDRHHRNVPPLAKDGRVFVPGDCVVYTVDAYNGAVLWKAEIPDSRRLGVFLDCGSMVVDERHLHVVAKDKCHRFDVQSGVQRTAYEMPQVIEGQRRDWGYVGYAGSILFGSGVKRGATYTETSYDADLALWYRDMKMVTSDYLFAKDREQGADLWTYRGGLIVNATITISDGRVYFVETHSPRALANELGRMTVRTLFDGTAPFLVCLDSRTGERVFKRKIDVGHFEEPVYLNGAKGVLLLSGSRLVDKSIRYYYDAFDAASGAELWHASHDTGLAIDGGHGEYNRHPTIVGDVVYAWPYAYELATGKKVEGWEFDRRGHGCGGLSASAQCLFWRGSNPWMYDLGPGAEPQPLNRVTRPGCWINMIPAGGLVLVPEASSGCTCGFPLQTSLAYIPERLLN